MSGGIYQYTTHIFVHIEYRIASELLENLEEKFLVTEIRDLNNAKIIPWNLSSKQLKKAIVINI